MKNRIVQAATKEIAQRGLKFSIRDLANRLGISTKTLYQHFASKELIVACIVEQAVSQMKERERLLMTAELPLTEKLYDALVIVPQGFAFSDVRVLKELQNTYPEQWAVMDDYLNEGWDNIRLMLQAGMDNGDLRAFDIETFIRVYVGAVYQLMDRGAAEARMLSLEEALARVVDLLLRGILAPTTSKEVHP
ncbi:TetR/AcrR family transcriptional regulator [Cohnella cholangitidis]|uniref:TetR/AcrR family transcriptional regulator n=1 Tax=Cohnella cholangitidis TaxID=2598458 RepID=A0A7G5C1I2_9BACL|nr:TetR/AcrR family transcriptional regulator [Cohnella cholangitidis]QMV43066.1 TetR/AcrR family transcriptional regulator [Cohnella cholangitidis]